MREIFTSGSVGGLVEQSLSLPGHARRPIASGKMVGAGMTAGHARNLETRNSNTQNRAARLRCLVCLGNLDLFRISCFGFRLSHMHAPCVHSTD